MQCEGIAPEDIPVQDIFNGGGQVVVLEQAEVVDVLGDKVVVEAATALKDVVFQDVDPVEAGNGGDGIAFLFKAAGAIAGGYFCKFAGEDFNKKITVSAGRLQKAGFDTLSFLLDQVQHGVDFPGGGVDFAVVGDTLF